MMDIIFINDFIYLNIVYKDLSESSWEHVTGLFVASITNVGHQILSLETSTNSVINTLGLTPVSLQRKKKEKFLIHPYPKSLTK